MASHDSSRSTASRTAAQMKSTAESVGSTAKDLGRTAKDVGGNVSAHTRRVAHSDGFKKAARIGHVANGILHLVIGVLAWQIAFGGGSESADQSGAAKLLADNPFGLVLVWVTALGCVLLALFHLASVVWGGPELKERVKSGAKAVVFAAIGFTFAAVGVGANQDSGSTAQSATATAMSHPLGAIAIMLAGAAVIVVGGYHVYKGVTRKFAEDLTSPSRSEVSRALTVTGTIGYVAKGIVLGLVGFLFILAGVTNDPQENTGMDGAMKTLLEQPYGVPMLAAIGVGLILHGVYQFLRSRYDHMES